MLRVLRTAMPPVNSQHIAPRSWDNVEELSAAAAHKKVAFEQDKVASDPLEQFCEESPDADEWVPPRLVVVYLLLHPCVSLSLARALLLSPTAVTTPCHCCLQVPGVRGLMY
jgi:hypothetical protein